MEESRFVWESRYRASLRHHINCVKEAGKQIGVSPRLLDLHDNSKWWTEEFGAYARQHQGPKNDKSGYQYAWLHHIHNNPHHWQHWRFSDDGGPLVMPMKYCLEMVADWMGSSKAYTGSFSMDEWLKANIARIASLCHPKTMGRVYDILNRNGYYPINEMLYQWGVVL